MLTSRITAEIYIYVRSRGHPIQINASLVGSQHPGLCSTSRTHEPIRARVLGSATVRMGVLNDAGALLGPQASRDPRPSQCLIFSHEQFSIEVRHCTLSHCWRARFLRFFDSIFQWYVPVTVDTILLIHTSGLHILGMRHESRTSSSFRSTSFQGVESERT